MPELPDPVVYAVPAFILLLIAEMIISLRRDRSRYEARDTLTSLMLGTVSQVAGAFVGAAFFQLAEGLIEEGWVVGDTQEVWRALGHLRVP